MSPAWQVNSLPRVLCLARWMLNHQSTREVPQLNLFIYKKVDPLLLLLFFFSQYSFIWLCHLSCGMCGLPSSLLGSLVATCEFLAVVCEIQYPSMCVFLCVCVCVCVCFLCQTLCDHLDCSPSGSFVSGISQARIPEWVAISQFPDQGSNPAAPPPPPPPQVGSVESQPLEQEGSP